MKIHQSNIDITKLEQQNIAYHKKEIEPKTTDLL
jgi:hypothetical protein